MVLGSGHIWLMIKLMFFNKVQNLLSLPRMKFFFPRQNRCLQGPRKRGNPFLPVTLMVLMVVLSAGCDVVRILWWNSTDLDDYKKFPNAVVLPANKISGEQFHFAASNELLPSKGFLTGGDSLSFHDFMDVTGTVAWLVLHNDTLRTEYYADGWDQHSLLTSFSVAKSFVGTLIGIAVGEGFIQSVDQPVTDFVAGLTDTNFRHITLRHLLNMRSGIDFEEGYHSLFSPMPRLYYGRRTTRQVQNLRIAHPAGLSYQYQSVCTQLLSMSLEKATGMSVAAYLSEKLWQPLGMESEARWSRASRLDTTIKSFCCLNAVGRDYLRFGRLWMNHGQWGSLQVIPKWYVVETLSDTLDSKESRGYAYSHQWRILPDGSMFAKGVMGQYIWVNPQLRLVIVRFGNGEAGLDWARIFRQAESYYSSPSSSKKRL